MRKCPPPRIKRWLAAHFASQHRFDLVSKQLASLDYTRDVPVPSAADKSPAFNPPRVASRDFSRINHWSFLVSLCVLAGGVVWPSSGCSEQPAGVDALVNLDLLIALPVIDLVPGQQRTICYYTSLPTESDVAIRTWSSSITNGAHGLQVFTTPMPIMPDGTLSDICDFQGPEKGNVARSLYEGVIPQDSSDAPVGVAMPMRAHQPLIIRMHLLNPTDFNQQISSEVRATMMAPGESYIPSAVLLAFRENLTISPNVVLHEPGACAQAEGRQVYRMSSFSLTQSNLVEVFDGSGQLYRSTDYGHPGAASWQTTPHMINGPLTYTCRYLNTSLDTMRRGGVEGRDEACAVVAHYYPATQDLICPDSR